MVKGVKPLARKGVGHPARKTERNATGRLFFPYFGLAILILAGVMIGAIMAERQDAGTASGLHLLSQELLSRTVASQGFLELFFSSFFSTAILLCAAYFLGLWAVGFIGVFLVALFKGAGIGLSMGYIYIHYGVSGFMICALFVLPWALITSFTIVVACREGLSFSFRLARTVLPMERVHLWQYFRMYTLRFVVCFGLAALAAVIEAGSTMLFASLFF